MKSFLLDLSLLFLFCSVLFSLAFVLGAMWHHAHLCAGCEREQEEVTS